MSDLINRQDAIDAIEKNAYRHTYLDQITGIIKRMPSAERKGKWIFKANSDGFHNGWYVCSECGEQCEYAHGDDYPIFTNYCPNCGADMRGEDDE